MEKMEKNDKNIICNNDIYEAGISEEVLKILTKEEDNKKDT